MCHQSQLNCHAIYTCIYTTYLYSAHIPAFVLPVAVPPVSDGVTVPPVVVASGGVIIIIIIIALVVVVVLLGIVFVFVLMILPLGM